MTYVTEEKNYFAQTARKRRLQRYIWISQMDQLQQPGAPLQVELRNDWQTCLKAKRELVR